MYSRRSMVVVLTLAAAAPATMSGALAHGPGRAMSGGKKYQLPMNLTLINDFFGTNFTPAQAEAFIAEKPELQALPATPFDAVLTPTCPVVPPAIAEVTEERAYNRINLLVLRNTLMINILDGCSIAGPMMKPGADALWPSFCRCKKRISRAFLKSWTVCR